MNHAFSNYVTGSAFRIDLTTKMVGTLIRAAEGKEIDTGSYGVVGLINRGLAVVPEKQERQFVKIVHLTEAGMKVAELCIMAGLTSGRPRGSEEETSK